MGTAKQ